VETEDGTRIHVDSSRGEVKRPTTGKVTRQEAAYGRTIAMNSTAEGRCFQICLKLRLSLVEYPCRRSRTSEPQSCKPVLVFLLATSNQPRYTMTSKEGHLPQLVDCSESQEALTRLRSPFHNWRSTPKMHLLAAISSGHIVCDTRLPCLAIRLTVQFHSRNSQGKRCRHSQRYHPRTRRLRHCELDDRDCGKN
jgi:hypothetical protein